MLVLLTLAACEFQHGAIPNGDSPDGMGSGSGSGSGSNTVACWSYTPTNFDPCVLPPGTALHISADTTINADSTMLPKLVVNQPDGSQLTVIHLDSLTVDNTRVLTLQGSTPIAFAVEGAVTLSGYINAASGIDNTTYCATSKGGAGMDSTDGGAGGGAGGGGAAAGGKGTNGSGSTPGTGALASAAATSNLAPMRAGCSGGNGGKNAGAGTFGAGGRGGGGLQISTNTSITVSGTAVLDAAGRGGKGGPDVRIGGGGGGAGGAIFLEGPDISIAANAVVCADGGSGGEGGGSSLANGNNGNNGKCDGAGVATTDVTFNATAGSGGDGSFKGSPQGGAAGTSSSSGAGGGGGGAVGWIRLKSPSLAVSSGAILTPMATN